MSEAQTADVVDEFAWYRDALAGKRQLIYADQPQSGYFRRRLQKGGPFLPVGIWRSSKTGQLVARIGDEAINPIDIWVYVADQPVPRDDAVYAFKNNEWPEHKPAAPPVADAPAPIGDNKPPSSITDKIRSRVTTVTEWLASTKLIKTDDDASVAANAIADLREMKASAEKLHEDEKEPHLTAGRAVDAKYKPQIKLAEEMILTLRKATTVYQKAVDDALAAERKRLADIELAKAKEAHAERIADELAAHKATAPLEPFTPPPMPAPKPTVAAPVVKHGGTSGRAITLKPITVAKIVDYDKALYALKDHPEVRDLVQLLANRACKAKIPLNGVEYVEDRVSV